MIEPAPTSPANSTFAERRAKRIGTPDALNKAVTTEAPPTPGPPDDAAQYKKTRPSTKGA